MRVQSIDVIADDLQHYWIRRGCFGRGACRRNGVLRGYDVNDCSVDPNTRKRWRERGREGDPIARSGVEDLRLSHRCLSPARRHTVGPVGYEDRAGNCLHDNYASGAYVGTPSERGASLTRHCSRYFNAIFLHDYRIADVDRIEIPFCVLSAQADTAMAHILVPE